MPKQKSTIEIPICKTCKKKTDVIAKEMKRTIGRFQLGSEGELIFKAFHNTSELELEEYICAKCCVPLDVGYADWKD